MRLHDQGACRLVSEADSHGQGRARRAAPRAGSRRPVGAGNLRDDRARLKAPPAVRRPRGLPDGPLLLRGVQDPRALLPNRRKKKTVTRQVPGRGAPGRPDRARCLSIHHAFAGSLEAGLRSTKHPTQLSFCSCAAPPRSPTQLPLLFV